MQVTLQNFLKRSGLSRPTMAFVALAFILAWTPLYTIAYIVAIMLSARYLTFSKVFSTTFARLVLAGLLLSATIMFGGMLVWMMSLTLHPIFILVLFGLLVYICHTLADKDVSSASFMDRGDVISILLALSGVVLLLLSFYTPRPDSAASIQIMTNGYDNTAHFSILRTTSDEHGYVYGRFEDVKDKTITPLSSYPQGWHLATSYFIDGLDIKFFQSKDPLLAINTYVAVVIAWYVLAAYVFSRLSWWLLCSLRTGIMKKKLPSLSGFVIANLLIQFLIYWSSLTLGFANYLGCMAYLILVAAMIAERETRNQAAQYAVAALSVVAVSQTWLLPFAAIIVSMALAYFAGPTPLISFRALRQKPDKRQSLLLVMTFISIFGALFQVAILLYYFSVGKSAGALTQDGGVFLISSLLAGVIVFGTTVFWATAKSAGRDIMDNYMAIIAPVTLMCGAIFCYQLITTGRSSYYYVKMLGLVLCLVGVFLVPAFAWLISKLGQSMRLPLANLLLATTFIAVLLPTTGQTTASFNDILQRYSKVELQTADGIEKYLDDYDVTKTQVIVFRNHTYEEDFLGTYAAARTAHQRDLCSSIVTQTREQPLQEKLGLVDACATKAGKVLIITSNETLSKVKDIQKSHKGLTILNVP